MRLPHQFSLSFASGCVGALVMSVCMWFFGAIGICENYEVNLHPDMSQAWLFPKIIYGGLWALLLVLPWWESSTILKALCTAFVPLFYQLFVSFPIFEGQGLMGQELGSLTPAFMTFYWIIWGLATGLWLRIASSFR